jgi:hypothetical protein
MPNGDLLKPVLSSIALYLHPPPTPRHPSPTYLPTYLPTYNFPSSQHFFFSTSTLASFRRLGKSMAGFLVKKSLGL